MICDQLVLYCAWVAKRRKTCINLRTNLSSTKVHVRPSIPSGWPNERQVERKSKTGVDLRVRMARAIHLAFLAFNLCLRISCLDKSKLIIVKKYIGVRSCPSLLSNITALDRSRASLFRTNIYRADPKRSRREPTVPSQIEKCFWADITLLR